MNEYQITFCHLDDETKTQEKVNLMAVEELDAILIFQQAEPFTLIIEIKRV